MESFNPNLIHSPNNRNQSRDNVLSSEHDIPDWLLELHQLESFFETQTYECSNNVSSVEALGTLRPSSSAKFGPNSRAPLHLETLLHTVRLLCKNIPEYLLNIQKNAQCIADKLTEHSNNFIELQDYIENAIPEEI